MQEPWTMQLKISWRKEMNTHFVENKTLFKHRVDPYFATYIAQ